MLFPDLIYGKNQPDFPSIRGRKIMSGIKGFLETSFVDWSGRVCAVIFLGGCNLRCPFCHNHELVTAPESIDSINLDDVLARLSPFKKWLGGICISGGEPTLSPELPDIIERFREKNWKIKMDTNGTRPQVLSRLLAAGLIDMVSMDVKAPLEEEKYNRCAGTSVNLEHIKSSISLLKESGVEHEFRMTVLPAFHSEADIRNWANFLSGGASHLKLQNFNPRTTMDPDMVRNEPFSQEKFDKLRQIIS